MSDSSSVRSFGSKVKRSLSSQLTRLKSSSITSPAPPTTATPAPALAASTSGSVESVKSTTVSPPPGPKKELPEPKETRRSSKLLIFGSKAPVSAPVVSDLPAATDPISVSDQLPDVYSALNVSTDTIKETQSMDNVKEMKDDEEDFTNTAPSGSGAKTGIKGIIDSMKRKGSRPRKATVDELFQEGAASPAAPSSLRSKAAKEKPVLKSVFDGPLSPVAVKSPLAGSGSPDNSTSFSFRSRGKSSVKSPRGDDSASGPSSYVEKDESKLLDRMDIPPDSDDEDAAPGHSLNKSASRSISELAPLDHAPGSGTAAAPPSTGAAAAAASAAAMSALETGSMISQAMRGSESKAFAKCLLGRSEQVNAQLENGMYVLRRCLQYMKKYASQMEKNAKEAITTVQQLRDNSEKLTKEGIPQIYDLYMTFIEFMITSAEGQVRAFEKFQDQVIKPLNDFYEISESKRLELSTRVIQLSNDWKIVEDELQKERTECMRLYNEHESLKKSGLETLLNSKNERKMFKRAQQLTKLRERTKDQFKKLEQLNEKAQAWKKKVLTETEPALLCDLETFERRRIAAISRFFGKFENIMRKNYVANMDSLISAVSRTAAIDSDEAIQRFTMKSLMNLGGKVPTALLPSTSSGSPPTSGAPRQLTSESGLPASSSIFDSRSEEESALYEKLLSSIDDDETKSSSSRKSVSVPAMTRATSSTLGTVFGSVAVMDSLSKVLEFVDKTEVHCVKVLYEIELDCSFNSRKGPVTQKLAIRPGDVIKVTSFDDSSSEDPERRGSVSESSSKKGMSAWWLGYITERKRGFEVWFPNTYVAPLEVTRAIPLSHLLEIPMGVAIFEQYLKKEHSEENLDFWRAASMFEYENVDTEPAELARRMNNLVSEYIDNEAPRQVNIRGEIQKEILESVAKMDDPELPSFDESTVPPCSLFNAAVIEIFQIMERDTYKRFKQSELFEEFLVRMGLKPADLPDEIPIVKLGPL